VERQRHKLRGLLITHGHMDHIGALPWWQRRFQVPIFAPRFAMGLIRHQLQEHGLLSGAELIEYKSGEILALGRLRAEPFAVSHSIPDGFGFRIKTPLGYLVHSGDFKMDGASPAGQATDRSALKRFGDEGVLALMSDSTNAHRSGSTGSEREVGPGLEKVFSDTPGRVIATCFASNVQRFQHLLNAAAATGRKVATLGRSMNENMQLASDLGILEAPKGTWVDIGQVMNRAPGSGVVVSTGSQGEPNSGLLRIAMDAHKDVEIGEGDRLIYSARAIPGNERWVSELFNRFYRQGAQVITERDAKVHVSGHGSREDLETMLDLVRPRFLLPGHGEERHQEAHRALAAGKGMDTLNIFALRNGERWVSDGKKAWIAGSVPCGEFLADGLVSGDDWEDTLKERRALREDGVVCCVLAVRKMDGKIMHGPDVFLRGVAPADESRQIEQELALRMKQALGESNHDPEDIEMWEEVLRRSAKRYFKKTYSSRPVIVPAVQLI
jgi:ribonuclease J